MKRADKKTKMVVGAFIITLLALMTLGVLVMGDRIGLMKGRTQYLAAFKNTSGLRAGAMVRMGGVDIGSVDSIMIEQQNGVPTTLVSLSIFKPHDDLVREESEVALETQGVLGDKFVMLYPGPYTSPRLKNGGYIKIKEKPELDAVVAKSTDIIDNVSRVAARMENFANTLPDARTMQAMTRDTQDSIREMRLFLASLNQDGTMFSTLRDKESVHHLKATLERLDRASASLESVAAKIDKGEGTLGALVNDTALYDDMRNLMGRANRSKVARFLIRQAVDGSDDSTRVSRPDSERKPLPLSH